MTEREAEIRQHLGWLQSYLVQMTETNWADMRLRAERQLHRLSELIDAHGETVTPAKSENGT